MLSRRHFSVVVVLSPCCWETEPVKRCAQPMACELIRYNQPPDSQPRHPTASSQTKTPLRVQLPRSNGPFFFFFTWACKWPSESVASCFIETAATRNDWLSWVSCDSGACLMARWCIPLSYLFPPLKKKKCKKRETQAGWVCFAQMSKRWP